jgi:hypothetical protein
VHGGERITPPGGGPIIVNVELTGELAPLANFVDARVMSNTDNMSACLGQRATERLRSGRFR